MNCHDIENRISAYLDNELSSDDRKQFEAHLAGCQACGLFVNEMKQVDTLLLESTPPLPDEAYWAGFDARLKEKVDKIPAKRPWWNFGHIFRKQLHWAALAALVVMAVVFPVLREFVAPPASMTTQAPVSATTSTGEKQAVPADAERAKDENIVKNEVTSEEAASGVIAPEQPAVVHAPAPGASEPDALVETEGGSSTIAAQPEEKPIGSSADINSGKSESSDYAKAKSVKKEAEIAVKLAPPAPVMADAAPAKPMAPPAEPPAPVAKAPMPVVPRMEASAPTGSAAKTEGAKENKTLSNSPVMAKGRAAAPGSVAMKTDKFADDSDVLRECTPDSRLYDPKTEEARKVAQVPEVNDYLAASEAVLIRIITLPEDEKKLRMLQEELNMANFRDTVNKTSDKVKNVQIINTHTKTMQTITDEVMNINPGKIGELKRKVIDSGIIDKTRELKQ